MTSVCLINPWFGNKPPPPPSKQAFDNSPLGILYLAGWLERAGHTPALLDMEVEGYRGIEYHVNLLGNCSLIGMSVMTEQIPNALHLSRIIRNRWPGKAIVWGGVHPTLFPEETLRHELVDAVVVGEGERPLEILTDLIETTGGTLPERARRIWYGGGTVAPRHEEVFDLPMERHAAPAYHILPQLRNYLEINHWVRGPVRSLSILTSRGCSYNCTFCINVASRRRSTSFIPQELIIQQIADLYDKFQVDHVFLMDENFFSNSHRAMHIAEAMTSMGITWEANIRVDTLVQKFGPAGVTQLVRHGCVLLRTGNESGSQRVLDMLEKRITPQETLEAAKICKQAGLRVAFSFMINLPHETTEDMIATYKLIHAIRKVMPEAIFFGPQTYRPYPGSKLTEMCCELGLQLTLTLDEWANVATQTGDGVLSAPKVVWNRQWPVAWYLSTYMTPPKKPLSKNPLRLFGYYRRIAFLALLSFRLRKSFWWGLKVDTLLNVSLNQCGIMLRKLKLKLFRRFDSLATSPNLLKPSSDI